MRAKLRAVYEELRKRMTRPAAEQSQYLRAVVVGHMRCCGVPRNGIRLKTFRFRLAKLWSALCAAAARSGH